MSSVCFLLKAMAVAASDLISTEETWEQAPAHFTDGVLTVELNLTQLTQLQGRLDLSILCSYDFCALPLSLVPQPRAVLSQLCVLLCAVGQVLCFIVTWIYSLKHNSVAENKGTSVRGNRTGENSEQFLSEKSPLLCFVPMEALSST